ncbi:MAG: response regulator transcription factor [Hyphomicrobiaceae bacterium]
MTQAISIIDDDPGVLDALSTLFSSKGYEVVTHSSAKSFLNSRYLSGCVISDVRMPEMTGLDLLREMKSQMDPRPIVILTGHGDIEMAVQAVRLGAFEFVEKPFKSDKLMKTVEQAEVVLGELTELRERFESLTQRQKETMRYLIEGLATKDIALKLGLSPRTVEIHRAFVMSKMNAKSVADLLRICMRLGWK